MEIERMSYIFGSFARRRSAEVEGKRKCTDKIASHDRSKSTPHNKTMKKITPSPRAKSVCNAEECSNSGKCFMCKKEFVEPKLLPCLHTFCLKCLEELLANDWLDDQFDESENGSPKTSSASGYVSDKIDEKFITCPSCGTQTELPAGGLENFPPNYLILNRAALTKISEDSRLLCDLCLADVSAHSRCTECTLNLCEQCKETHLREKNHQVLTLDEARKRGIAMRKHVFCEQHRKQELCIFCYTCYEVICKDCWNSCHKSHKCEPVTRAAKAHLIKIRTAAEKAKTVAEQTSETIKKLQTSYTKVEMHCNQIQTEVDQFISDYVKSLEEHKSTLREEIYRAKEEQLEEITRRKIYLNKKLREAKDVACFVDDLLSDGSDVEVMSFLKPVLERVRKCTKIEQFDCLVEETLQFFPRETSADSGIPCPIYGMVTSQIVSPLHCVIVTEGINNLRVGKKSNITLETRDTTQTKMKRGGEQVAADVRYRDAGNSKVIKLPVEDRKDGSYLITLKPQIAGKLVLNVTVKGQVIKNCPFPITVRTLRPHQGTFHCCTFCSSGGTKEAGCGCGGKMPGGYKGCGHGHDGHPGRRHWSCCGNTLEHSECTRSNSRYQFTL